MSGKSIYFTLEAEASNYLIGTLEQVAGMTLSTEQKHAAFQVLCTLPDSCTLADFVAACDPKAIATVALNPTVASLLAPVAGLLARRLNSSNSRLSLFGPNTR